MTEKLFSILTPVHNPPEDAFNECVESVLGQIYQRWQWCIVDDCSTDPWVRPALERLAASDDRINVVFRDENGGISNESNDVIVRVTERARKVLHVGHGYHRVRRHLTSTPTVSVIIPTRGTMGRVWGLDISCYVAPSSTSAASASSTP